MYINNLKKRLGFIKWNLTFKQSWKLQVSLIGLQHSPPLQWYLELRMVWKYLAFPLFKCSASLNDIKTSNHTLTNGFTSASDWLIKQEFCRLLHCSWCPESKYVIPHLFFTIQGPTSTSTSYSCTQFVHMVPTTDKSHDLLSTNELPLTSHSTGKQWIAREEIGGSGTELCLC